jgi:hypothetical protein
MYYNGLNIPLKANFAEVAPEILFVLNNEKLKVREILVTVFLNRAIPSG